MDSKKKNLFPLSGVFSTMLRLSVAMAVLTPCISADAYAQTRSTSKNVAKSYHYSGTVIDEENEPLPGATVLIKGSNGQGTATDADGRFTLSVNDPNCVLMVSYVGMKSMEVKATAGKPIDIRLESSDNRLNEIVVTGYQTLSKERATGSFDIIDKKQLQKATGNIASRLMGAAAGLASTQDLYGNPTFEIRGTSSFSVNSAPLLVVDGFAIEGGFESINPNDVESVTVLKDAAAASIWGAKSANGVIVITTKSGAGSGNKNTVVNVDYSGFYKISPKMNLDYALSRVSSDDLINYEIDTFDKWGASMWWPEESSAYSGGSNVYNLLNDYRLGHITQQQMNEGINRYRGIDKAKQYADEVLAEYSELKDFNDPAEMSYFPVNETYTINSGTDREEQIVCRFPYTKVQFYGTSGFPELLGWKELLYARTMSYASWWFIPSQALLDTYATDVKDGNPDNDLRYRYFVVEDFGLRYSKRTDDGRAPGFCQFYFDNIISGPTVAEMMLIKAEVEARKGTPANAIALLNTLRKARIATEAYTDLPTGSKEETVKRVLEERRREMPLTMRWYDIKRYAYNDDPTDDVTINRPFYKFTSSAVLLNDGIVNYTLEPKSRHYAMPIPEVDILRADGQLVQNTY